MANTTVDLTEYNGDAYIAACVALLITSWIAVGLRTYTRVVLMKKYQADDWLMLVAQVGFYSFSFRALLLRSLTNGTCVKDGLYGGLCIYTRGGSPRPRQAQCRSPESRRSSSCPDGKFERSKGLDGGRFSPASTRMTLTAAQWQALTVALYIPCMMFVKLSIGVFLLRLATQKVYIQLIRVVLVIVVLWSTGIFLWNLFQCTPVEKQWDFRITTGHCAGPSEIISAAYALSVMTVLSDWFFVSNALPLTYDVRNTSLMLTFGRLSFRFPCSGASR